jgi:hypothetical protein
MPRVNLRCAIKEKSMKSILLSVLILTTAAACAQDVPMSAASVSPMPIGKVRKIYVRVDLYHGSWRSLGSMPLEYQREMGMIDAKPKGHLREKLRKDLAGTCIQIMDSLAEADASLGLDYTESRRPWDGYTDSDGYTSCTSRVVGYEVTTTCTGDGIWTTSTSTPYGGYSLSGPILPPVFEELVLYDAEGNKVGNWSLRTEDRPSHKDLADELFNAVGCGTDVRQSDAK